MGQSVEKMTNYGQKRGYILSQEKHPGFGSNLGVYICHNLLPFGGYPPEPETLML